MVIYSFNISFIAITAIILLLYFVIFLAYDSFISAIIVDIRVGIKVIISLKKLRLRVIYIFSTAIRPVKYF